MSRRLGWAERAVDAMLRVVSRRRYFHRQHFRRMADDALYREAFLAGMRARGYRAAKQGDGTTGWFGGDGSADREIVKDLPTLRARGRELERDDPIADGLVGTFVNNVVGSGLRPLANTGDLEKDKRIDAVFCERKNHLFPADASTYGEAQRLIYRRYRTDGDILVKRAIGEPGEPVWFEVVEGDRIFHRHSDKPQDPDGDIRSGVERDRFGRIVAYWVSREHPGDAKLPQTRVGDVDRVPRESTYFLRQAERPGQSRGVPAHHAILQDLRDLDLLILASLKRVQIAACLSVFITSEEDISDLQEVTAQKYGYKLDQTLEPGMIFKLYPNEKLETLVPNFPTTEFEPFIVMLARRIGAALGVSWQIVLKDFSRANYSSARTDLLEARQGYVIEQQWFADFLSWQRLEVLVDARLRGDERLADCTDEELAAVIWIPPGWQWIDPHREAAATEIELRLSITTLRDVCAAKGKDWEEVLRQRITEQKLELQLRREAGLPDVNPMLDDGASGPGRVDDDEDERLAA